MDSLIESTKENYKEEASTYDSHRFVHPIDKMYDSLQRGWIVGWLNSYNVNTVLDVGCGTGRFSITMAQEGFKVTAVDQSEEMLNEAKSKANGLDIIFIKGDIFKLPFENSSFDAITCIWVLRHFEDKHINKIISEFKRVLKEGGVLIFDAPTWGITKYLKKNTNPKTIDRDFDIEKLKSNLKSKGLIFKMSKGLKKFPMRLIKPIAIKPTIRFICKIETTFNSGKEHLLLFKKEDSIGI